MVFKNLERGKEEEIQDDGAEGDVLQVFTFLMRRSFVDMRKSRRRRVWLPD